MSDRFEWTDLLAAEFAGRVSQLRNERDLPELLQKFKEEKTNKEWEIMSYDNTPAILSVKRLSDGEVFGVGDELDDMIRVRHIVSISIRGNGDIWLSTDDNNGCGIVLSHAKKAVKPKPLFVTEDGVELFDKNDKVCQ